MNENTPINELTPFERLIMRPGVKEAIVAMYDDQLNGSEVNFLLNSSLHLLLMAESAMTATLDARTKVLLEGVLNAVAGAVARYEGHVKDSTVLHPWKHFEHERKAAYTERNHLVAVLANVFPSGIRPTDIPGWDPAWQNCVYIDLPTGQISYHYHDDERELFAHLPPYTAEWDEHTKADVHDRLKAQAAHRPYRFTTGGPMAVPPVTELVIDPVFPLESTGPDHHLAPVQGANLTSPYYMLDMEAQLSDETVQTYGELTAKAAFPLPRPPLHVEAVVAYSNYGHAIGKDNQLTWKLPMDMARFKSLTTGHAVIMGRKTAESIGRALPKRLNIVVTRSGKAPYEGQLVADSMEKALELVETYRLQLGAEGDQCKAMVIGGEEIYRLAIPYLTGIHSTCVMAQVVDADAFWPAKDVGKLLKPGRWQAVSEISANDNGIPTHYSYDLIRPAMTLADYRAEAALSADELCGKYTDANLTYLSAEHPSFSAREWQLAVEINSTMFGYWNWVLSQVQDEVARADRLAARHG